MSQELARLADVLRIAAVSFESGSRRLGRTEAMLAQVRPGDQIVTATEQEANRLRRILRDRRVADVRVVAAVDKPLDQHPGLVQHRRPTAVDHAWVLRRLLNAIEREEKAIQRELDHIQGRHIGLAQWPRTDRSCIFHPGKPAITNLDGEDLCQQCANAWARSEGEWQQHLDAEGPSDDRC